ncbi:hypothetical protein H5410_036024 [Solanum commersonii]|uniref:DUF4283 domain-containing protein n=1 Tax=Solanum commersonii TaxID=4109 RepID=A0A9J5Y5B4_SOLCO|nr:hypothetical protein H5410_036024 [Solanum commersonii]
MRLLSDERSFKEALNKSTWIHDGDNGEIMKGFYGGNKAVSVSLSAMQSLHKMMSENGHNSLGMEYITSNVKDVGHVMKESWRKPGKQSQAGLVWIRVLGLPLQLWSNRGYKGDWGKIWRMVEDGAQESLEMGLN